MAFTPSAKDMDLLSNAVLDGTMEVDKLPQSAQFALQDYWSSAGIDFNKQGMAEDQMQDLIQQRRDASASGGIFDSPLFKPIEWVGSKLYQLYSATVSPVLTTGLMAAHSLIYGRSDYIGQDGGGYWSTEWDALQDYWDIAHHVSPGQAVWQLGFNNEELKKRGIEPGQMAEDLKLVKAGEYRDEKTEKDPFGVKTKSQEYFGDGVSKFVTGATDFAVSWYMDPLVLGGKAAGATKTVGFTKPVVGQVEKAAKKAATPEQAFDLIAQKPVFQSMVDTVMNVKTKSPDTAALTLRRDMPTLAKSANGDALARLLSQAKDADEVSDILRLSMGDDAGRLSLEVRNAKIGAQVGVLTQRNVIHANYFDALTDAQKASPRGQRIKAALDTQTDYIAKMNRESRVIDDKLDAFASVDNMNFNRVTTPLGMRMKGSKNVQEGGFKPMVGQGAIKGTAALVYNSTIGLPIKVLRSYNDIRPSMYLDVHGEHSFKDFDASLREVKGLTREQREEYVSRYINATPNERQMSLIQMEQDITHRMVDRYNATRGPADQIDYNLADDLYKDFAERRRNGQASAGQQRVYGTATMPDPMDPSRTIRVADVEADGGRIVSTPIFDSQLANSHVMMDFRTFERALEAHGSTFQRIKNRVGDGWYKTNEIADTLSTTWKFAQLFRLGYAPRALADDFLGQVARFGGLSMAQRAISGGKVTMQDFIRGKWASDSVSAARQTEGMLTQHIDELSVFSNEIKAELVRAKATGADAATIARLEDDMLDITDEIATARSTHADYGSMVAYGQQMRDVQVGREVFSAPFAGKQGELYRDLAAGSRNFQNLMGTQADWYLKKMRRLDWENVTVSAHGADKHMEAWMRHVNDQVGQSAIGRQALEGKSEAQLVDWMRNTPAGQKYRKDIGLKNMSDYELAQRVKAQVDYVMDPAMPGMDAARAAVLQGKLTKDMLDVVPAGARPMVNGETFKYAEGTSPVAQLLDKSITGFYNLANQIPATKLLRNPLFGQSYKAHLADQLRVMRAQGVTHIDETLRKTMETNARKGALDDVKKYTFTMDHETKMAYSMRHFGAFFGAQQESWNRWGRIISDKPDILARVAQTYGMPARAGITTDHDGNPIDASGHIVDPVTGERKLVKYSDRRLIVQVPEYLGGKELNKTLGLDEDASFVLPMSSLELILNHGDGALPVGAGPYVQIAANHFAQEDPKFADWSKKLGVLPFGAQESWTDFINPNTGKRLGDATDDMGQTKQRALFNMMQVENYKWEQGLRDTQPTWKELKDRADRWTIFRTAAAWSLPFSVNGQDPYQFFRDEFSRYQKLDPNSADEKFYEKYGDSFYQFTQSMSKNNSGLKPTAESVKMSKYYQDLIDKVGPEYAGLIVGDEGDGVYSEGAYFYQKTHSAGVGSTVTQRGNMSAREAWDKTNLARGWQQYNSFMQDTNSQLFDRGLTSFDDEGAEDLKATKQGIVKMLTEQFLPDGSKNPFYNEAWEREFSSLDKGKYDRQAAKLEDIVNDPEMLAKSINPDGTVGMRSDMYTLRAYLAQRKEMNKALMIRKMNGGSEDITAQSNYDLKNSWDRYTMMLIEADTKFGWVHSRYFATDMGFNLNTILSEEAQAELEQSDASLIGEQATGFQGEPSMFDVMEDESSVNANTIG
ncbi:hypothetical protein SEA_TORITOKI_9 [Streptomyces phage ToriToki]|uniref:Uncharacterized protein n=1 Tax=Streptomyces phage ToriToki TaxID=2060089 RepID=A0A2H5BMI0_9CAUD|nr:hypothetical protein SEA_TORITOKI_9 [Streptomyces phage ToriToki]